MKTKILLTLTVCVLAGGRASRAANDPTGALQKGLFEEEANHNLDAAIAAYQSVVTQFDQDRKLAGTAVFRLGECYRKLGRTNEAVVQYQRVLRDFSDQAPLVTLSRQDLGALGVPPAGAGAGTTAPGAVSAEANLLAAQLTGLDLLKNAPEERARAVLALFPDDQLKDMLLNLPPLQEQEARWKADPNWKRDWLQIAIGPGGPRPPFEGMPLVGPGYFRSGSMLSTNHLADAEAELNTQLSEITQRVDFIVGNQKARLQVLQAAAGPAASPETANASGTTAGPDAEPREIQRIQTLLAQSPDLINAPGKNGETLLQAAAGKGQLEVVQFLLDHGAAVNGIAQPGLTPLHFAAGNGHLAVVDLLLRRGAKPDRATRGGVTPLYLAALKGYAQVAKALIDAGAPVNVRTSAGNGGESVGMDDLRFDALAPLTPLDVALYRGFQNIVELLIAAHADTNTRDDQGRTPLMTLVGGGQKAMVPLLLDHGANVNAADDAGATALHRAAQNGSPELVALLLAHKADVNAKDKAGTAPLHLAALNGNSAAIKALLAAKAEINIGNNQRTTPLEIAASYDKRDAAGLLLAAGADPNAGSVPAPLLLAVACPDEALARMLLEHGANPNASGNYPAFQRNPTGAIVSVSLGEGPVAALEIACDQGNAAIVKLLLDHGASVNARNKQGKTPLRLVVEKGSTDVVTALLRAKADPNLADTKGDLPLHAAIWRGDQPIVEDLLRHGAAVESKNSQGLTPLALAVTRGNTNVMVALLDHGADVNAKTSDGYTPLQFAVIYVKADGLAALLAHHADVNAVNNQGQTALDILKQRPPPGGGQSLPAEMVEMLRRAGAQDWVPRPGQITVTRRSTDVAFPVFRQGTNALNHFTLFEAIAALPWGWNNPGAAVVPFPDFSKVTITRRDPKTGKLTDIPVDAAALVAAGDCSKDMPLEWGDLVDIPDREHKLNEQWRGLPDGFVGSLAKCLGRKLTVEVKGQQQTVSLFTSFDRMPAGPPYGAPVEFVVSSIALPFRLKAVLTGSARLLSTSDLTRVTVRRVDPATGQPREWVFNEQTVDPVSDLWVRDGDVIAVPEKP